MVVNAGSGQRQRLPNRGGGAGTVPPVTVVDALLAIAASDPGAARRAAEAAAADEPGALLPRALARFLGGAGPDGVYEDPTAFERFIDGGGNPALYARTIAALGRVHELDEPASVLDIGCGDGRVTAATVTASARSVDLVEPSVEMLRTAAAVVAAEGREVSSHPVGIHDYLVDHPQQRWDLVQSTFALHALEPGARSAVLAELARRTHRLLIVDFDVPDLVDRSPEHARHVVDRYELGLAEYADDPEVVDGFLLPVLVGQFDPARQRHTFEQSVATWTEQLTAAGFTVEVRPVSDYWWATAQLFDARVV